MKKPRAALRTLGRSSKTPGREVSIRCTWFELLQKSCCRLTQHAVRSLYQYAFQGSSGRKTPESALARGLSSRLRNRVERRVAILVIFLVVGQVIAVADPCHPFGIGAIPVNGLAQAIFQRNGGVPAQLSLDLVAPQGIAAVVAGTVFHVRKQRFGFAGRLEQTACQGEVFQNIKAANVVNL